MSSPDPGDDAWLRHALLELRPGLHPELAERLAQVVLQLGGPAALSAFPLMASELKGSETELTGPLKDRSALFGALAQIEALGVGTARAPADPAETEIAWIR